MINGRPLLQKSKLKILIDTDSFNTFFSKKEVTAKLLLHYSKHNLVEFHRTPFPSAHTEIGNVSAYSEVYNEQGHLSALEIASKNNKITVAFHYSMESIEQTGTHLLGKENLCPDELQQLLLVFIQGVLNQQDVANVFVTDKDFLLQNRLWFESSFPGIRLNILTLEETKEILDLFLKFHKQYHILRNYKCNKGWYYFLSFRSKVPHYHYADTILEAFAVRFRYLLISVDEIGFQYFLGTNNDTLDDKMYHFNYFITLVTGIFDNLAIRTNEQYELGFSSKPQKVSLNPIAGKNFLRTLRDKNPELRELITKYVQFIKLIYELREVIIHRQLLEKSGFESIGAGENWNMNGFAVGPDIMEFLRHCPDVPQKFGLLTEWGIYELAKDRNILEPYHFAKAIARNLISFSDEYLRLLGFSNFLNESKDSNIHNDLVNTIALFKENNLGL